MKYKSSLDDLKDRQWVGVLYLDITNLGELKKTINTKTIDSILE